MNKQEFRKLMKYILVSILIVCFIANGTMTIIGYVNDKISAGYLYTEKYMDEDYILYLEGIENMFDRASNDIIRVTGVNNDQYPVTGATIEMLTVLSGVYQLEMFVTNIIMGIFIGSSIYILKKDNKKIIHYIALYVAMFLILVMTISIIIMIMNNIDNSILYVMAVGYLGYIDLIKITILPYTVIYALVCCIIHATNKRRAEKLNEYIKK